MSALSSIVNGSSPTKTKQPPAPLSFPAPAPAVTLAPATTIAAAIDPSQNGKTPTITTTTITTTTPLSVATHATPVDDVKYKRKYKDLRKRIRDIEDDNDVLNIKLSRARKNIHRLRVERGLDQTEHPVNTGTALTSSSSSSLSSSDLDSDADQNGNRSSRSHRQHPRNGLDRSRSRHSRYSSALGSSSHLHHTTSNSLTVPGSSLSHSRPRSPHSRASSFVDATSHGESFADTASLSPSSGKKAVKKRRKDPLAPKRPSNAFFIFSQQHRQQAREEKKEGNQSELTKFLGQQWKSMPSTEKQIYSDLAVQDRQRYLDEMSHYQHENGISSAPPTPKRKPGRPGRPPKTSRLEAVDIPSRSNSETPTTNAHSIVDSNSMNNNSNKMGIHSLVNDEDVEDMSSHEEDYSHMSFEDEHEQDEDDDDDDEEDEVDVGEVEGRHHHHHPGHIKRNSLGEADVEMTEFPPALPTLSVNGLLVNN